MPMAFLQEITDITSLAGRALNPDADANRVLEEAITTLGLSPSQISQSVQRELLNKINPAFRGTASNLVTSILKSAELVSGIKQKGIPRSPARMAFPHNVENVEVGENGNEINGLGTHYIVFRVLDTRTSTVISRNSPNRIGSTTVDSLKAVITLFHPQNLRVSYGKTWTETDFGYLRDTTVAGGLSDIFTIDNGLRTIRQIGDTAKEQLGGSATKKAWHQQGKARNPKLEMLFEGVQFRQFNFNFVLAPKSKEEVVTIIAMIKAFKYASAPGLLEGGNFFSYPSKFEIESVSGDANDVKFGPSVITNIDVNYSPQGIWQTFVDGFPVAVEISLDFTETILMTKDKILAGY